MSLERALAASGGAFRRVCRPSVRVSPWRAGLSACTARCRTPTGALMPETCTWTWSPQRSARTLLGIYSLPHRSRD